MSTGRAARLANRAAVLALLGLLLAWNLTHAWPGGRPSIAVVLGLPLALVAAAQIAGRPSASFWSGVVALLAFSHGVTEAWTVPAARLPALSEVLLSLAIVASASWNGLRVRFGGRRGPPPAV